MSDEFDLYLYEPGAMEDIAEFFRIESQQVAAPISSDKFFDKARDIYQFSNELVSCFIHRCLGKRVNPLILKHYETSIYNIHICFQAIYSAGYLPSRIYILQLVDALLHRDERDLVLEFNGEFPILFRRAGTVYINHQFDDGTRFPFHVITLPTQIVHMPVR